MEVCRGAGCYLMSDEMYRGLEMPGVERLPPAADLYERYDCSYGE
jgi:aspartate/methionine/tyrosine aminotransferase